MVNAPITNNAGEIIGQMVDGTPKYYEAQSPSRQVNKKMGSSSTLKNTQLVSCHSCRWSGYATVLRNEFKVCEHCSSEYPVVVCPKCGTVMKEAKYQEKDN